MKGRKMLPALLIVLGLGGGTAGYLYHDGYWDTWADRQEAIKADFVEQLQGQAPQEVVEAFAGCLATGGTELAEQLGCDVPDADANGREAVQECAVEKGGEQQLGMVMLTCILQAQAVGAQGQK